MNLIKARAVIEALVFASSEPIRLRELSEILEIHEHTVRQLLTELKEDYERNSKGIQIVEVGGGFQFVTNPECAEYVEKLRQTPRQVGLSTAAIETLAIIVYKQPITRAEIESLRGVRVDSAITTLIERDLIKEAGRKDAPGKPILYVTTKKFLTYFGLKDLKELPSLEDWSANQRALSNDSEETQAEEEEKQ